MCILEDSPDSNVAKRRRLEIPNDSNDVSSPPLNDEKKQLTIRPTTSSIHNLRRTCMRETTSNTETREPTRLNNNNNKETINHEPGPSRPMPPWTLNKEPIVISSDDDDDDDVQVFENITNKQICQFSKGFETSHCFMLKRPIFIPAY